MRNLTLTSTLLAATAVLALSGCGDSTSSDDETMGAPSSPATATATAEPTEDLAPAVLEEMGSDADWTTAVEETEPGRIEISTNLVDDREDGADSDAARAVTLCNDAVRVDGVEYVAVFEADGTNWILYGHPMVPEGECGEI